MRDAPSTFDCPCVSHRHANLIFADESSIRELHSDWRSAILIATRTRDIYTDGALAHPTEFNLPPPWRPGLRFGGLRGPGIDIPRSCALEPRAHQNPNTNAHEWPGADVHMHTTGTEANPNQGGLEFRLACMRLQLACIAV